MMNKYRLMSPGPTPIPPEVSAAGALPIIHHRTPEFGESGFAFVFPGGTLQDASVGELDSAQLEARVDSLLRATRAAQSGAEA